MGREQEVIEIIAGLISFAALIIVWGLAPTAPATSTAKAPSAAPQKAVAS